jgi:NTP pyrophosphatase (non-canonical NTP hydrolase)
MGDSKVRPDTLQLLQDQFDEAHGLRGLGGKPNQSGVDLGAVQFAALALCGECGEIANAIKKAVRAVALGASPENAISHAKAELGDAYAYLLKLSTVLGADLDEIYLETLALNHLRFKGSAVKNQRLVIGLVGQTVIAAAPELERTISMNGRASTIHLPEAPDDVQSFVDWLAAAQDKILSLLSADRDQSLLIANDPAYYAVTIRARIKSDSVQAGFRVAQAWANFEIAISQQVTRRFLLLSAVSNRSAAIEKLLAHGAREVTPAADWAQTAVDLR